MKSKSGLFFSAILPIVSAMVLLLLHLTGCGGGVTGTGDIRGTQVEGRVFKTDGAPLEGAQVTLVETGDSTSADAQGEFLIRTNLVTGDLTLSVVSATVNAVVSIGSVSEAEPNIRVELQVDEVANTIEVVSVTKPTPIPISSSFSSRSSSNSQSSEASASSSSDGSPAPTPIPLPTSTPTPSTVTYTGNLSNNPAPGQTVRIEGATVRVVETGAFGITGNNGTFEFSGTAVAGDITIEVIKAGKTAQATINNVPSGTTSILFVINLTYINSETPPDFSITIPSLTIHFDGGPTDVPSTD